MKVVEETGEFDVNNSKGKKAQEVNKMKKKDVASVTAVSEQDLPLQAKMMKWKEKVQELGTQLDKLMKQQEEVETYTKSIKDEKQESSIGNQ